MKIITLALSLFLLVSCSTPPDPIPLTNLDPSYAGRGEYLVKSLAACGFCHGDNADPDSPLSGGRAQMDNYGEAVAPNLTPHKTGLKKWNLPTVVTAIRNSVGREEDFSPAFHRGFEWMSDTDAISIGAYLQSLPPVDNSVERRSVGFFTRNTVGIFEATAAEVPGYVPSMDRSEETRRGEYLVNNVARCQRCHNSPGSLLENERYLAGGGITKVGDQEKITPGLIGEGGFSIGSWSESSIVNYLRTGLTQDDRQIDSTFCPIEFYKLAADKDLVAIAKYLKSVAAN